MRAFPLAFLLIVGCTALDEHTTTTTTTTTSLASPIVAGTPSSADEDATVMLLRNGAFTCTGTLIAPTLVITARHCIAPLFLEQGDCGVAGPAYPANELSIALGVNARTEPIAARGLHIYATNRVDLCGADIAILEVDRRLTGQRVAALRGVSPPVSIGEAMTAVGYGESGLGTTPPARQRRAGVTVTAVGPASTTYVTKNGTSFPFKLVAGDIATTESTCVGDSGGPLFDANLALVGVTSRGIDDRCIDRPTIFTDLAPFAAFIDDAFKQAGYLARVATPRFDGDGNTSRSSDDGGAVTPPLPPVVSPAAPTTSLEASGSACAQGPRSKTTVPTIVSITLLLALFFLRKRSWG